MRREERWLRVGITVVACLLLVEVVGGTARRALSDEPTYLENVETCLTERMTQFAPVVNDPIAESTARGALRTMVEGNGVTVVLGSSEADAERVYEAYVSVAPDDIAGTRLELNRKVVFLWDAVPTPSQHDFMVLCTLDAQE
jgi:hypothetical protein